MNEYAVHYAGTNMVARTPDGGYHIYPTREEADQVALELGEGYEVKTWGAGHA